MVVTDLRTVSFDVPKQEVLTKDSVTVNVDAVVYYNIYSPLDATCKVEWVIRSAFTLWKGCENVANDGHTCFFVCFKGGMGTRVCPGFPLCLTDVSVFAEIPKS